MATPTQFGLRKPVTPTAPADALFTVPPPAKAIPGLSGSPPLPAGQMVSAKTGYTDQELATLQTIPGWTPEQGVPSNLPELLAQVSQLKQEAVESMKLENMSPPVAADFPKLKIPEAIDISKLPAAQQQSLLQGIEDAKSASLMLQKQREQLVASAQVGSGINEMLSGQNIRNINLEDDTEAPTYAGTNVPKTEPAPTATGDTSRTGVDHPHMKECPHCHWKLDRPDIPDPSEFDKQNYLQSVLGLKPFQKLFKLFNDQVQVVFRELHPQEVDLCFKQAKLHYQAGEITSNEDYLEIVQRYRLCLQLVSLQMGDSVNNFPPSAQAWAESAGLTTTETAKSTVLPQIHDELYGSLLKTESLNHQLGGALTRFNRLLTKMEANADNPNFWQAPAPTS